MMPRIEEETEQAKVAVPENVRRVRSSEVTPQDIHEFEFEGNNLKKKKPERQPTKRRVVPLTDEELKELSKRTGEATKDALKYQYSEQKLTRNARTETEEEFQELLRELASQEDSGSNDAINVMATPFDSENESDYDMVNTARHDTLHPAALRAIKIQAREEEILSLKNQMTDELEPRATKILADWF